MAHVKNHDYHILSPSIWPLIAALSAFVMLIGAVLWLKDITMYLFLAGFVAVLGSMFGWWSEVLQESNNGEHNEVIRIGLRMGFIMFVMSEVFFFFGWFWSFFKHTLFTMPAIEGTSAGVTTVDPFHLPLINTLILLLSGSFVTWAHHEIAHEGNNKKLAFGLIIAAALGGLFSLLQAYEYSHLNFGLVGDVRNSNFYLATGFHGFHVLVGTIFLLVSWLRARKEQFTKDAHVGFEAAAWYWHFVDVVWLFLFVAVYVWAGLSG